MHYSRLCWKTKHLAIA